MRADGLQLIHRLGALDRAEDTKEAYEEGNKQRTFGVVVLAVGCLWNKKQGADTVGEEQLGSVQGSSTKLRRI